MVQPNPSSAAALPMRVREKTRRKRGVRRGLRWQSTVAAVAVVAVAMLTGGLLLLQTLESALVSSTDSLLRSKVQDVAVLIQNDHAEEATRAVAGTVNKDP
ncbi:hypothetical protein, partial [Arthrobacter sp. ZGTC412]|uniref:hypothetical protein n=1 Tax=Arthrobacter sp. ZGTC412 TaxID=2058900 RepID=UPI00359F8FEE